MIHRSPLLYSAALCTPSAHLAQRAELVGQCHQKRLLRLWGLEERQRPHVALDDILLLAAEVKDLFRVAARPFGVREQMAQRVNFLTPARIEMIVMQHGAARKRGLVHLPSESLRKAETFHRHAAAVAEGRVSLVLAVLLEQQHMRIVLQLREHTEKAGLVVAVHPDRSSPRFAWHDNTPFFAGTQSVFFTNAGESELLLQLIRVHCEAQGGLFGDAVRVVEAQDGLVHADQSLRGRGLDDEADLMDAAFAHQCAHGVVQVHDLKGRNPLAVYRRQQQAAKSEPPTGCL